MMIKDVLPDYVELYHVLLEALTQAQSGKGYKRHSHGLAFKDQPIFSIRAIVGDGFTLGQAIKKLMEASRLSKDKKIHELLGAIIYIAAEILVTKQALHPKDYIYKTWNF